jgi:hypothetical protein
MVIFLPVFPVFHFRQKLLFHKARITRVDDHIRCKVQNFFQSTRRHVQKQPHTAGNTLKKPDMGNGRRQLDMTHAFAAYFGACHFHTATVADYPFVANAFVFAAMALPVFLRAKDLFTKQALPFRLQRPVVDGFGFLHFPP